MVENTKIEWATHTFNPWIGCSKVSPGCEHCYAETLMDTRYGRVEWGVNGTRVLTSDSNWRQPLNWNRDADAIQQYHSANLATDAPRLRVFCASLADVFENRNELIPWRQRLFHVIGRTPNLDWLILTKRPENVTHFAFQQQLWWPSDSIPRNVWIGTSVENRKVLDSRSMALAEIPAAVRFLSVEPLLEDLGQIRGYLKQGIDWVIVGGESGPGARPMHPDWVRSIRDQCQAAGVPFFFKQWGEWMPDDGRVLSMPHTDMTISGQQWGGIQINSTRLIRVGKKAAGRLLDGREWNEFPTVQTKTGG